MAGWIRVFGMLLLCALPACAAAPVSSMSRLPEIEQGLLASANRERAARGLPALQSDPALAKAAHYHAQQMVAHGELSHQFPGEPDLAQRGLRVGLRFSRITENVAVSTNSSSFHEYWMNSPGHRANLLDPAVTAMGVAVVAQGRDFYAVEDFAATVASLSVEQEEATVARLLTDSGLTVGAGSQTATLAQARAACGAESGFSGAHRPWFIMRYSANSLDRLPPELVQRIQSGKYKQAVVGACQGDGNYNIAVLLYP